MKIIAITKSSNSQGYETFFHFLEGMLVVGFLDGLAVMAVLLRMDGGISGWLADHKNADGFYTRKIDG